MLLQQRPVRHSTAKQLIRAQKLLSTVIGTCASLQTLQTVQRSKYFAQDANVSLLILAFPPQAHVRMRHWEEQLLWW